MPSPFPGMDPYIEAQANWQGFHTRLVTYIGDQIAQRLPDDYVAEIEQQVRLESPDEDPNGFRPDVVVARHDVERSETPQSGIATLEPVAVPFPKTHPELIRQRRVEIRRLPEMSLVTVIELLSPDNKKPGQGRDDYLVKREILLTQAVHLVEIDLLLGGRRLPMGAALPAGDYYAFVARVERWPSCDVYTWSVRDRLPTIPIPLRLPDPDVPLDLAPPVPTAYEHGRYRRTTNYAAPLPLPLEPDARAWAEGLGRK